MSAPTAPSSVDGASSTIFLKINGRPRKIENPDSNRTLLSYLRETACLTGTKEGCAEGDCGACTVVVREGRAGGDQSRAVNACIQLLPTLHGKEVVTVEGVKLTGGRLHPVQEAMVACHASQCGFCTPGFVMSLFALSESATQPTRTEIERALAGNLCRCTGYRPIVDAAQKSLGRCGDLPGTSPATEPPWISPAEVSEDVAIELRHPERNYWAPTSLMEFARLRVAHPEATVLAGGTDLGLVVTKKRMDLRSLLYIGRIEALRQIEQTASHLEIGAAATLTDAFVPLVDEYPELADWARRFASPPIRNVGTLGGNIGNGSPIGDSMPVLMALGSSLVLRRGMETREVALDAFYTGYQRNVLMPGEFIERIRVPLRRQDLHVRAYKISKRFDQDISALCAAFAVYLDDEGRVARARIAFGGMAAVPKRAVYCETALTGKVWCEEDVFKAMDALDGDFEPIDDMRASKGYRSLLARNLLHKCFLESAGNHRITVIDGEV